jgi:hypothetical protein
MFVTHLVHVDCYRNNGFNELQHSVAEDPYLILRMRMAAQIDEVEQVVQINSAKALAVRSHWQHCSGQFSSHTL